MTPNSGTNSRACRTVENNGERLGVLEEASVGRMVITEGVRRGVVLLAVSFLAVSVNDEWLGVGVDAGFSMMWDVCDSGRCVRI